MRAATTTVLRAGATVLTGLLAMSTLSSCSLDGRGSLPFAAGVGSDSYQVQVQMADVANLVPNAEVKVNDITVGTVTEIRARDWHAELTVQLAPAVQLPANAIANVGQKSLLGAQYLQLSAPLKNPTGQLVAGAVIPVERTGTYPATEDLLIAVSSLLNGSGLTQLKTITTEVNNALDGRTDDFRSLLEHMRQLAAQLTAQRKTMSTLLDRMNSLTTTLAKERPRIARALPALAPGLAELERQRPALTAALKSVDELEAVAGPTLTASSQNLSTEIRQLRPVLKDLADVSPRLPAALNYLGTGLYPADYADQFINGDYFNGFYSVDMRPDTLNKTFFTYPGSTHYVSPAPTFGDLMTPTRAGGGS